MPFGFADPEIADAEEKVKEKNYEVAAHFVMNAKQDIEDYAVADHGANKEEFDKCCDNFRNEVKKNKPSDGQLLHVIKRMRKFLRKMEKKETHQRNY